jgi:hypothetical protein
MFSRSNLGDCRLQIIERAKCRWGKNERRKETWLRSRERGLWLTLDHKSTMWELRSLSNDFFDRRLSREEKTDEAKKTLKRLDVRVLRIETAYAEVCLLACVTRRNRKRWKRSGFCTLHQTRPRDSFKPDLARHQQTILRISVPAQSRAQATLHAHRGAGRGRVITTG